MKVAIRVDSSTEVGSGHLMRCLALARALKDSSVDSAFVMRDHKGNLNHRVVEAGFSLRSLPLNVCEDPSFLPRLGTEANTDALETLDFLNDYNPDWLVVDHYSIGAAWERTIRVAGVPILVIDDLANRNHDCDALLDQNFPPDDPCRYKNLVPSGCLRFLGPRYVLLNPKFSSERRRLIDNPRPTRDDILVSFGSTNNLNLAEITYEALKHPSLQRHRVNLVLGADHDNYDAVRRLFSNRPNTRLFGPQPDLVSLMSSAQLSIGAGGSTIWERRCLGLRSVVVSIASNQEPLCRMLSDLGMINYVGTLETISSTMVAVACEAELRQPPPDIMSESNSPYDVDGDGAKRIAQFMIRG